MKRMNNGVKRIWAAVVVLAGLAVPAGAYETVNLTNNDASTTTLTTAANWSNGIAPTADNAGDYDYVVTMKSVRTPGSKTTFKGHSMTFGSYEYFTTMIEKGGVVTYENDGLILCRGSWDTWIDSTAKIYGPVTVTTRSDDVYSFIANRTRDNTFAFYGSFSTSRDDVKLVVNNQANNGTVLTLALYGDASQFTGKISVNANSRLLVTGCALPGTVDLTGTASHLDVQQKGLSLKSLTCAAGSKLSLWVKTTDGVVTSGAITTDTATVTGPVDVIVSETRSGARTVDSGAEYLLIAAKDGTFNEDDFVLKQVSSTCIPNLKLVARTEGGYRKLLAVRKGIVYGPASNSNGYWNQSGTWYDGEKPHGDADYCMWDGLLRLCEMETFPSEMLCLNGGTFVLMQDVSVISNLVTLANSPTLQIWHGYADRTTNTFATEGTRFLRGKITLNTGMSFTSDKNTYQCIQSDISGSESHELYFKQTSGQLTSYYELAGDNSLFDGKIRCASATNQFVAAHDKGIYLYVTEEKNLGGVNRTKRLYNRLTLKMTATLRQKGSQLTISNPYNGIYISDEAAVEPLENQTMTITSPLCYNGVLYKFGAGTLVLGGAAPTFGNDSATPIAESNRLVIAEGQLKPLSTNAFNNLQVTFKGTARLLAWLPSAAPSTEIATYGLKLAGVDPLVLDTTDSKLHVALDVGTSVVPERGSFPIITVPEATAALLRNDVIVVERPGTGIRVQVVEDTSKDGLVTFRGDLSHTGLTVIVR